MSGSIEKKEAPVKAVFSFESYHFVRSFINSSLLDEAEDVSVEFSPSGQYDPSSGLFKTILLFRATDQNSGEEVIMVECVAEFQFKEAVSFDDLPSYFFVNSTAIIYPYIRAYVANLSLQANYPPFLLPTLNVSALGAELKVNSVEI